MHTSIRPFALRSLAAALAFSLTAACGRAQSPAPPANSIDATKHLAQRPAPHRFDIVVLDHFDAWDTNHNGILEADEIDNLAVNPAVTGEPAAAVASLKLAARNTKVPCPTLSREFFTQRKDRVGNTTTKPAEPKPADGTANDHDSAIAPVTNAAGQKEPPFDTNFSRSLSRIERTQHSLFGDDASPKLVSCRQGPLGDCFFVSVVGAVVARNSDDIKSIIHEKPDGGYHIHWLGGRELDIAPLTDAELAISSTSTGEGLWLPVLEKAYGTMQLETAKKDPNKHLADIDEPTDAIARGGSAGTTIRQITGHHVNRVNLGGRAKTEDERKQLVDKALPKLRDALAAGIRDHRLMAAGTPSPTDKAGKPATNVLLPPAVNGSHAYAILGYNADKDTLTLWNPHRNNFTPKGEPGLKSGYPTKNGEFTMPLAEFAAVFTGASFETGDPDKPTSPKQNESLPRPASS